MNLKVQQSSKVGLPPVEILSNEWFALQFLSAFDPSDIRLCIKRDIDLMQLITENPEQQRILSGSAQSFNLGWSLSQLLFWFSCRRPDLYPALTTRQGISWLQKNFGRRGRLKEALVR